MQESPRSFSVNFLLPASDASACQCSPAAGKRRKLMEVPHCGAVLRPAANNRIIINLRESLTRQPVFSDATNSPARAPGFSLTIGVFEHFPSASILHSLNLRVLSLIL